MVDIKAVQLPDMLACREARAVKQRDLIDRYKRPVVSFSMNIAGEIKNTPAISMLQRDGAEEFKAAAAEAGLTLLFEDRSDSFTGPESLLVFGWPGSVQTGHVRGDGESYPSAWECEASHPSVVEGEALHPSVQAGEASHPSVVEGEALHLPVQAGEASHPSARESGTTHLSAEDGARLLKNIGVKLEEETPWGRLYDIDIIGMDGEKLSRPSPRRCIVCGGPAADCARSRAHGLDQIRKKTDELIAQYLGDSLGTAAASALVREASLTPKPGLVDAANNGAHRDMDLGLLLTSASSLRPFFAQMAGFSAAEGPDILVLTELGKSAEKAMFRATRGVNAHKGAVFAFALYLAAVSDCLMRGGSPVEKVKQLAAQKVALASPAPPTHGDAVRAVCRNYASEGALAEACKGFPMALLAAKTIREDGDELLALCRVMASLADSNVLYRGGEKGLVWLQEAARRICAMESASEREEALRAMDEECIRRNLSPGGAADMLALGMFLAGLPFKYTE